MVAAAIHADAGVTVRVSASHPEPYPARATKLGSSITPARESIAAPPHTQTVPLRRLIEALVRDVGRLPRLWSAPAISPVRILVDTWVGGLGWFGWDALQLGG